jgi:UDP-N-acetylmuramyl tripeptide synthase
LKFSRVFYSHLGHYQCPAGDYSRPCPDVSIVSAETTDPSGSRFTAAIGGERREMRFALPGTYNLYNALVTISVTAALGVERSVTAQVLATTDAAAGRMQEIDVDGRAVYLVLIKNPASFAQVLDTFLVGRSDLPVMMAVNDLPADGRDVSWLWDVPLEALSQGNPRIVAAGTRSTDMALRLHYAGMTASVATSMDDALSELVRDTRPGDGAYVLATYTAMTQIRRLLTGRRRLQAV